MPCWKTHGVNKLIDLSTQTNDRIEVESPSAFAGNITATNVGRAGSKARNAPIAPNLRKFPEAPNIDAGEGVTVTLLNLERPSVWNEVSAWIDREGFI